MEQQSFDEQHAWHPAISVLAILLPQHLTLPAEKANGAKAREIMSATKVTCDTAAMALFFCRVFIKLFIRWLGGWNIAVLGANPKLNNLFFHYLQIAEARGAAARSPQQACRSGLPRLFRSFQRFPNLFPPIESSGIVTSLYKRAYSSAVRAGDS